MITRLNVGKVGKKKTTCSICDSQIKGGFYANCHRSCPLDDKFCQTQSEIKIGNYHILISQVSQVSF